MPTEPDAAADTESAAGRFKSSALSPVEEREAARRAGSGYADSAAGRMFDRVLLAAEIFSAIVVAWLVAQYIYTSYIDTAPHRITPRSSGALPGRVSTPGAPTLTPTRVAEVLPPLQGANVNEAGDPGGNSGGTWHVPTATPTPSVDPKLLLPTRLRIPVMFLDSPVHEVTVNMGSWEVSPMQIGHHHGTGLPGQTGNVVLAGHRDINSALFRELDRLQPGDEVFVSNSIAEYRYLVTDSMVVRPDHTEVMDPTGDKRVTLITCTPIGLATQRLIVTALLDETYKK